MFRVFFALLAVASSANAGICPSGSAEVTAVETHTSTDSALTSETLITAKFGVNCGGKPTKGLTLTASLGGQETAVAASSSGDYQVSFFVPNSDAGKGTYSIAVSADGDSVTVPVWHAGAATLPLPVSTELVVLVATFLALRTAIQLA